MRAARRLPPTSPVLDLTGVRTCTALHVRVAHARHAPERHHISSVRRRIHAGGWRASVTEGMCRLPLAPTPTRGFVAHSVTSASGVHHIALTTSRAGRQVLGGGPTSRNRTPLPAEHSDTQRAWHEGTAMSATARCASGADPCAGAQRIERALLTRASDTCATLRRCALHTTTTSALHAQQPARTDPIEDHGKERERPLGLHVALPPTRAVDATMDRTHGRTKRRSRATHGANGRHYSPPSVAPHVDPPDRA